MNAVFAVSIPLFGLAALLQKAVTPCSLFALGALLSAYRIRGHPARAGAIILAKCIAFPSVVRASCRHALGLEALSALPAMPAALPAAQPAGVHVFIFAERYRAAREMANTAVFFSSAFAISIPLLLCIICLQPR